MVLICFRIFGDFDVAVLFFFPCVDGPNGKFHEYLVGLFFVGEG